MDLSMIKKASEQNSDRGTLTTIFGDAGVGKTAFAAWCWPKPLIVPIEWGLRSTPWVDATPQPKKTKEVFNFVNEFGIGVKQGSVPYQTLILDSISKFDSMLAAELCDKTDAESLVKYGGGYGAGSAAVQKYHQELRDTIERLLARGIHVVTISHAEIKEIKPPDGESYHQWNLQMTKGGRDQWINQADAVIHVKAPMIVHKVSGESRKIAKDTGSYRIINMSPSAATAAKNRFGVERELIFEMLSEDGQKFNNPIASFYGFDIMEEPLEISAQTPPAQPEEVNKDG